MPEALTENGIVVVGIVDLVTTLIDRRMMMRFLAFVCFACLSAVALAGSERTVVVTPDGCSECNVRSRAFNRGYVVTKKSVSTNSSTRTREVLDPCCNTVRSRTVTKVKCNCRDCSCDRCECN